LIVATVGNVLVWAVWILAAFACLGSGVAVVSFSNPFYSALALIGNLGSLAVLYLLLCSRRGQAARAGRRSVRCSQPPRCWWRSLW
jgi:hypothetical protein